MYYFINDNEAITIFFKDGSLASWSTKDTNFNTICKLAKEEQWIKLHTIKDIQKLLTSDADVTISKDSIIVDKDSDDPITIDINDIDSAYVNLIEVLKKHGFIRENENIDNIKPFLQKVAQNTYIDAIQELYDYLKNGDFEITTEGNILAYKRVNDNLTSVYDNKTKHAIGEYTSVNTFDTNRENTCSTGLHFATKQYLASYKGSTTILVEIDPRDIISIPVDYQYNKGRCKRYKTIAIISDNDNFDNMDIKEVSNNTVESAKNTTVNEETTSESTTNKKSRVDETYELYCIHKDYGSVAELMNISESTVKRNLRRYKAAHKQTSN